MIQTPDAAANPESLADACAAAAACTVCAADLPHGPRPVFRVHPDARLLIVGQAPGSKVHASGVPWDDPSGDRLRAWLALPPETFYDVRQVAIMPSGFCYPGRNPRGGDLPPRPECAPLWHPRLRPHLKSIRLTLLVGQYAQALFLGDRRKPTLTETVAAWRDYAPDFLPTPHPSWRTIGWATRHPWFEAEVLPAVQTAVAKALHP